MDLRALLSSTLCIFGLFTYYFQEIGKFNSSSKVNARKPNFQEGLDFVQDFHGRMLRVNYAVEKSRTGGFGTGGYGYSGSNYGPSGDYGSRGTSYASNDGNYAGGGSGYGGTNYGNSDGVNRFGSSGHGSTSSFGGEDGDGYDGTTGTTFANERLRAGNEDFDQEMMEENNKDDNDEVDDYANTKG